MKSFRRSVRASRSYSSLLLFTVVLSCARIFIILRTGSAHLQQFDEAVGYGSLGKIASSKMT